MNFEYKGDLCVVKMFYKVIGRKALLDVFIYLII